MKQISKSTYDEVRIDPVNSRVSRRPRYNPDALPITLPMNIQKYPIYNVQYCCFSYQ